MTTPDDEIDPAVIAETLAGLRGTTKQISTRWLYDRKGSELFEAITGLQEYYVTRTEAAIFDAHLPDMAEEIGPEAILVEYGAGALVKTRALLAALDRQSAYVPIDISGPFLRDAARDLSAEFPGLTVSPVVADFTGEIDLSGLPGPSERRVGYFPGSTIGNFGDENVIRFLARARAALGPDARFLLGADMKKDPNVLVRAYDDSKGISAAFIRTGLSHLNHALGATLDVDACAYEAVWNEPASQCEMYLRAERNMDVSLAGETIRLRAGEPILMEVSRKFAPEQVSQLAVQSGWQVERVWQDKKGYFSLILFA
ncbi:MAG: L-histidine N(alpha)-methyltransferase [Pseudomonadota bacterium]